MRFIITALILFPAVLFAQTTPSLYDDWYPGISGSSMHFSISKDRIITTETKSSSGGIQTFLALQVPALDAENVEIKSDPAAPRIKSDTLKLLKVVYDSAQAKGRLFMET